MVIIKVELLYNSFDHNKANKFYCEGNCLFTYSKTMPRIVGVRKCLFSFFLPFTVEITLDPHTKGKKRPKCDEYSFSSANQPTNQPATTQ